MGMFVADCHCDVLMALSNQNRFLRTKSEVGHIDLPRLVESGVKLQFMAAYVEAEYKPERALQRTLVLIDQFYREMAINSDTISLVRNKREIAQLKLTNQLGALLTIEGGEAIGTDLAILRILYNLGVRSLGLTWNQRNALADGVGEQLTGGGLTNFGREVVREMNRLGMLIDVSHIAEQGFWDVLSISQQPIIASHSNCQALCSHPRNLTDQQIKALAKGGGVIGITFAPAFLSTAQATIDDVVKHIVHLANLVGVEHIAVGSDFDGIDTVPTGLEDVSKLPSLIQALSDAGFAEQEIMKIMGENVLSLLNEVLVE